MRASYRSKLISGVVALTATAVVAAPAITPTVYAAPEPTVVSVPARAASDPVALLANPVSDFVFESWDWVVWGVNAAVDAGNFVSDFAFPLYLVGEQAELWFNALENPFLTPALRDGLVEVLDNPLNFDAWGSGLTTAGNGLATSVGKGIGAEFEYITSLGWLPFTLPPIPTLPLALAAASPAPAAADLRLAKAPGAGAIMDVFNTIDTALRAVVPDLEWAAGFAPYIGILAGQVPVLYNAGSTLARGLFQSAQDIADGNAKDIPSTLGNALTTAANNLVQQEIGFVRDLLPPLPGITSRTALNAELPEGDSVAAVSEKIDTNAAEDTGSAKLKLPVLSKLSTRVEKLNTDVKALFNRDGAKSKLPTLRGLRTEVTEKLEKTAERLSTRVNAVTAKLTNAFSPKKADANTNSIGAKDSETKGYQPKTQAGKKLQKVAQSIAKKLTPKKHADS